MELKNYLIWKISLFVTGITTMLLVVVNLVGIEPTNILVRICGTIDLISLPVFTFSTVTNEKQKIMSKDNNTRPKNRRQKMQ